MDGIKWLWRDGKLVSFANATTHVTAHSLHYGDSVFEGVRLYSTDSGPVFFRLEDHIKRLWASAQTYGMTPPWSVEELMAACHQVAEANNLTSAYLRPLIFQGPQGLGLLPTVEKPPETVITAFPMGPKPGGKAGAESGLRMCLSKWRKPAADCLPAHAKAAGNYLSSRLIAMEARERGYDDGLALNAAGNLCEASGANFFLVRDGKLLTPDPESGLLPGITRDSLLQLARDLGLDAAEAVLPVSVLEQTNEAFLCGTAAEITPVRSLDDRMLPVPGPMTRRLHDALTALIEGRREDPHHWLTPLEPKVGVNG